MRILVGHNYYQRSGGEDAVFRSETRMLSGFGHSVEIYERTNDEIARSVLSRGAFIFSSYWSRRSYRDIRALIRHFRPEIAHFHNIFYRMTPSVYNACRDEGVPIVQSLHNYRIFCLNGLLFRDGHPCEDCLRSSPYKGVKHRCFRGSRVASFFFSLLLAQYRLQEVWTRNIDRFIVATEFTRRKYVEAGIPSSMISVKPHFVEDPGMQGDVDGRTHALFIGRLSQEKGIKVLLEAWKEIKDLPLYIFGQGPMECEIREYIHTHKLGNVILLSFSDPLTYQDIMRKAKFIVVPSLCYENFPRVVVEAFSYGTAVLASRRGSLTEIIREGRTGVCFEPGDSKDLAAKARFLEGHPEFGRNAREEYERNYSPEMNNEVLVRIYQDVLNSNKK